MRFTVSVVGPGGRPSSKRPKLPGNFVRMDDKETFRLYFENDWDVDGTIKYVYDGVNTKTINEARLEANGICASEQLFVYERTKRGEGRLLEVQFDLDIDSEPYKEQIMFINNDYNHDGSAVNYGDVDDEAEVVIGRCTDRALDPDLDKRAN